MKKGKIIPEVWSQIIGNEVRTNLPPSSQFLLDKEELNGSLIASQIRFFIGIILFLGMVFNFNNVGNPLGHFVNFGALSIYILNTYIHRRKIQKKDRKVLQIYEYVSVFIDNAVIYLTIFYWYYTEGHGNPGFLVKNSLWYLFIFPLALTLFQFRIKLVIFSFLLFCFYFYFSLFYGLNNGLHITNSWLSYNIGDGIIIEDFVASKPSVFLTLTVCICYGILRTFSMFQKFANSEGQKSALSRYFSPDLIDEITSQGDELKKGKRQKVTVLFLDIRGFTSFSEKMDPEDLSIFLAEFRSRITKSVFHFGGTLDKFIGDAVMAVFGTPNPSNILGLDSKNAVSTAKYILQDLEDWNDTRLQNGQAPVKIGIGIHSGLVFAGNIGNADRMEYTVIGDTVNTASRIESSCKQLNVPLLISEDVWNEIGNPEDFKKMESIQLKGKEIPIHLYGWKISNSLPISFQ